jgi:hypothetical protein
LRGVRSGDVLHRELPGDGDGLLLFGDGPATVCPAATSTPSGAKVGPGATVAVATAAAAG